MYTLWGTLGMSLIPPYFFFPGGTITSLRGLLERFNWNMQVFGDYNSISFLDLSLDSLLSLAGKSWTAPQSLRKLQEGTSMGCVRRAVYCLKKRSPRGTHRNRQQAFSWHMHLLTPLPAQGILYSPGACSQEVCVQGGAEGQEPRQGIPKALWILIYALPQSFERSSHVIHELTEVWGVRWLLTSTVTLQTGSTRAARRYKQPCFSLSFQHLLPHSPWSQQVNMTEPHNCDTPALTVSREGKIPLGTGSWKR